MRQDNTIYVLVLGPSIPMIIIIKMLFYKWCVSAGHMISKNCTSVAARTDLRPLIPLGYATH